MKVLIAGGAGYIGSVIANVLLQNGYQVRVADFLWFDECIPLIHYNNPKYEFCHGNLSDSTFMEQVVQGVDYIIQTAAVVGEPACNKFPDLARAYNEVVPMKMYEAAIKAGATGFVFFSTCSNYGIADGIATEETDLNPLSLYAETKVNVERYLMDRPDGLGWVICRLSTAYGSSPRIRFDLTVNDFTLNGYFNKYLDIFLPYSYRPYVHTYDIAQVVASILEHFPKVKNNVFNVGFQGENYQKIEIAKMVQKYLPDVRMEIVKTGHDLRDYQVDFSKLERILQVTNTFTVEKGVKEIIDILNDGMVVDPNAKQYYNTTPRF